MSDNWIKSGIAAELIGVSPRTILNMGDDGRISWRVAKDNHTHREYSQSDLEAFVKERDQATTQISRSPFAEHDTEPDGAYVVTYDLENINSKRYHWDPDRRIYVFSLLALNKPFKVAASIIENMVAAYSKESGSSSSQEELAQELGWRKPWVSEVLRALQITKSSLPYTNEQIELTPEEELVKDLGYMKRNRVHREAQKQSWRETEKLAKEALQIDQFILKRIESMKIPQVPKPRPVKIASKVMPFSAVISATDVHWGKNGRDYNRTICRERLLDLTSDTMADVLRYGKPQEWIVPVGSDWFHVDTEHTTTKGTFQDTDGTFDDIFSTGVQMAQEYVQHLRQYAPVRLVQMRGNHDHRTSLALVAYLHGAFSDAKDVEIEICSKPRQYIQRGSVLMGFTHGDGCRMGDLPSLMFEERPEGKGECPYRAFFTGHRHTEIFHDHKNCMVISMPSIAGTDQWHDSKGYKGNRKVIAAYIVDHARGLKGVDWSHQPSFKPGSDFRSNDKRSR